MRAQTKSLRYETSADNESSLMKNCNCWAATRGKATKTQGDTSFTHRKPWRELGICGETPLRTAIRAYRKALR